MLKKLNEQVIINLSEALIHAISVLKKNNIEVFSANKLISLINESQQIKEGFEDANFNDAKKIKKLILNSEKKFTINNDCFLNQTITGPIADCLIKDKNGTYFIKTDSFSKLLSSYLVDSTSKSLDGKKDNKKIKAIALITNHIENNIDHLSKDQKVLDEEFNRIVGPALKKRFIDG